MLPAIEDARSEGAGQTQRMRLTFADQTVSVGDDELLKVTMGRGR